VAELIDPTLPGYRRRNFLSRTAIASSPPTSKRGAHGDAAKRANIAQVFLAPDEIAPVCHSHFSTGMAAGALPRLRRQLGT